MSQESKTPRTDAAVWLAVDVNDGQVVMAAFARNLERENAVLRGRVAELETEMENFDHAKSYIVDLEAKIVELEAARGEPVAFLHQVVCGDGEPDQALSFAPDNFPLAGALGYRSLSYVPLYTAPRVDVDAIGDDALLRGRFVFAEHIDALPAFHVMRAALRAIFNKGE